MTPMMTIVLHIRLPLHATSFTLAAATRTFCFAATLHTAKLILWHYCVKAGLQGSPYDF